MARRPRNSPSSKRRIAASKKRIAEKKSDRRGAYVASKNKRRSKPQYLTGRSAAASGIATANREKNLQQSVGSLDRRVDKALADGNTDLAKDLRSRQNKFVKQLGLERAKQAMLNAAPLDKKEQIRKQLKANPNFLNTRGFNEFQRTVDEDFIDPTRKLQNLYPDQYGKMYPLTNILQGGPLAVRGIRAALGKEKKQIPYSLEDMPSVRYPLDAPITTRSNRQGAFDEPDMTLSDRQPQFGDDDLVPAPVEDVLMQNIFAENDEDLILPNMAPFIDKETRNEVFAPDVDNLPANRFNELDEEFQKESKEYFEKKANEPTVADKYPYEVASNEPIKSYFNLFGQNDAEGTPTGGEQQLIDALNASGATNVQDELTSAALQAPGYNLNPNIIDQLFEQGFLTPGTNYANNDSLLNEALASYYDSLQ